MAEVTTPDQLKVETADGRPVSVLTWEDNTGKLHAVFADIAVAFTRTSEGSLTKHPIQSGGSIADHYSHGARRISVTLRVSQTPLFEGDGWMFRELQPYIQPNAYKPRGGMIVSTAIQTGVNAVFDAVNPLEIYTLQSAESVGGAERNRIRELEDSLDEAWVNVYPITINLADNTYERYTILSIENISVPDEFGEFRINAERVDVTSTAAAPEGSLPKPVDLRMKPPLNKGKTAGQQLAEIEKKAVRKTLLASGIDATAGAP